MANFLCVFMIVIISAFEYGFASDCGIEINAKLTETNFPLLADAKLQFIYPTVQSSARYINITEGSVVTFACPGSSNYLSNYVGSTSVQATCTGGTTFQVNGASADFTDLYCNSAPKETVVTAGTCGPTNEYTGIKIGYNFDTNFVNLIGICFDESTSNTLFSVSTVYGPSIDASDVSNARPSFKEGSYYPTISCNTAYSESSELTVVSGLVQSDSLGAYYINTSSSMYFARGHLSPDGAFIYTYQQNATYYYINAVPQWQCINNDNWKSLETSVTNKAAADSQNFTVYTGSYEILELYDVNSNLVDIYLSSDSTGLQLPAPLLVWKVIHNLDANTAVAIININNPHLTSAPSSYIICDDICDQIDWLTISDRTNLYKGYTYCCTVQQFANVVPTAPNLGALSLLV